MSERHLILCGGCRLSSRQNAWREAHTVELQLGRNRRQLRLRIQHISRALARRLPAEVIDLLEIAGRPAERSRRDHGISASRPVADPA